MRRGKRVIATYLDWDFGGDWKKKMFLPLKLSEPWTALGKIHINMAWDGFGRVETHFKCRIPENMIRKLSDLNGFAVKQYFLDESFIVSMSLRRKIGIPFLETAREFCSAFLEILGFPTTIHWTALPMPRLTQESLYFERGPTRNPTPAGALFARDLFKH